MLTSSEYLAEKAATHQDRVIITPRQDTITFEHSEQVGSPLLHYRSNGDLAVNNNHKFKDIPRELEN